MGTTNKITEKALKEMAAFRAEVEVYANDIARIRALLEQKIDELEGLSEEKDSSGRPTFKAKKAQGTLKNVENWLNIFRHPELDTNEISLKGLSAWPKEKKELHSKITKIKNEITMAFPDFFSAAPAQSIAAKEHHKTKKARIKMNEQVIAQDGTREKLKSDKNASELRQNLGIRDYKAMMRTQGEQGAYIVHTSLKEKQVEWEKEANDLEGIFQNLMKDTSIRIEAGNKLLNEILEALADNLQMQLDLDIDVDNASKKLHAVRVQQEKLEHHLQKLHTVLEEEDADEEEEMEAASTVVQSIDHQETAHSVPHVETTMTSPTIEVENSAMNSSRVTELVDTQPKVVNEPPVFPLPFDEAALARMANRLLEIHKLGGNTEERIQNASVKLLNEASAAIKAAKFFGIPAAMQMKFSEDEATRFKIVAELKELAEHIKAGVKKSDQAATPSESMISNYVQQIANLEKIYAEKKTAWDKSSEKTQWEALWKEQVNDFAKLHNLRMGTPEEKALSVIIGERAARIKGLENATGMQDVKKQIAEIKGKLNELGRSYTDLKNSSNKSPVVHAAAVATSPKPSQLAADVERNMQAAREGALLPKPKVYLNSAVSKNTKKMIEGKNTLLEKLEAQRERACELKGQMRDPMRKKELDGIIKVLDKDIKILTRHGRAKEILNTTEKYLKSSSCHPGEIKATEKKIKEFSGKVQKNEKEAGKVQKAAVNRDEVLKHLQKYQDLHNKPNGVRPSPSGSKMR